MSLWSRIKKLFGAKDVGFTDDFPSELETNSRGVMELTMRDLQLNGKFLLRSCYYESLATDSAVKARFHPDQKAPPNPQKWKDIFDRRLVEFEQNWQQILVGNKTKLNQELEGWLPPPSSVSDLIASLSLEVILISEDESVDLGFETSPMLEGHDLGIAFNAQNTIKDISVEG